MDSTETHEDIPQPTPEVADATKRAALAALPGFDDEASGSADATATSADGSVTSNADATESTVTTVEASAVPKDTSAAVDPDATLAVPPDEMDRIATEPGTLTTSEVPDVPAEDLVGLTTTVEDESWQHDTTSEDVFSDESSSTFGTATGFTQDAVPQTSYGFGSPIIEVKPSNHTVRNVLIALVIVAVLLGGLYCGIAMYFKTHFLPNTTVNGEDVSNKSVSQLAQSVTAIGENYSIHVEGDGIKVDIPASEIDFVYDGNAYAAKAQEQIPFWTWFLELASEHDYTVSQGITYSEEKLDVILNNHVGAVNKGATDPVNANMAYDADNHVFIPVSETLGTKVELQSVLDVVNEAVSTMQTEVALTEKELVQPTVSTESDKIVNGINQANTLLGSNISMRIAGVDVMGIERDLMASWFQLNDARDFTVNTEIVKQWTQGPLSEFLDTIGKKRTYTRPDGKVCEVEGGFGDSAYGWLLDGEALANVLTERLQTMNLEPIEIPMKKTAANWAPGGQEWPARYIDVDLGEQYVRMFDENAITIWEAPCVSGNPIYGGGTDPGVYYIYDKASPMVLVGLDYNHDGEPDYRTDVTYWMPFDGGEGLHDAGWRGYFGGSIYTYDGSHGCVNLPYYSAQELYGLTVVGDVVVVHW